MRPFCRVTPTGRTSAVVLRLALSLGLLSPYDSFHMCNRPKDLPEVHLVDLPAAWSQLPGCRTIGGGVEIVLLDIGASWDL